MIDKGISGTTRLFGVVGDPVRHSLSPFIHNRWLAEAGIDAVYVALHLRSADAGADLRTLARSGFSGLNVTLPHKIPALGACSVATDEARLVGAANTLTVGADLTWAAHNTDVEGFAYAVGLAAPGLVLAGSNVVLVGAGGAARAALAYLQREGASITIANRSIDNAARIARDLSPGARVLALDDFAEAAEDADIVVNSASLGHGGGILPSLPPGRGRPYLDMSYGQAGRSQITAALAAGWTPHDGLAMLVGQAAAAFRLWHGSDPDVRSALGACRVRMSP